MALSDIRRRLVQATGRMDLAHLAVEGETVVRFADLGVLTGQFRGGASAYPEVPSFRYPAPLAAVLTTFSVFCGTPIGAVADTIIQFSNTEDPSLGETHTLTLAQAATFASSDGAVALADGGSLYVRIISDGGHADIAFMVKASVAVTVAVGEYVDRGADEVINEGQRYLDLLAGNPRAVARFQKDMAAGECFIEMKDALAVTEVWLCDGEARIRLERFSATKMRREYPQPTTLTDRGLPQVFCDNAIALSPELAGLTGENFGTQFTNESEGLHWGGGWTKRGLWLMPPPDRTYTVIVIGQFRAPALVLDADESYWTEEQPEMLVWAARYILSARTMDADGGAYWADLILGQLRGMRAKTTLEEVSAFEQEVRAI